MKYFCQVEIWPKLTKSHKTTKKLSVYPGILTAAANILFICFEKIQLEPKTKLCSFCYLRPHLLLLKFGSNNQNIRFIQKSFKLHLHDHA